MSKPTFLESNLFRAIKRSLVILGIALGIVVGIALLGISIFWVQSWGFHIGNVPTDTCGNCHAMDSYVESQFSTEQLSGYHAIRGITCTDCHPRSVQDQVQESIAQVLGNYDDPLPRQKYPQTDCFQCHEHSSYEQIAWRTTDLGISDTQAGGTEANPHQPPHYEDVECNLCHRVHQTSTLLCGDCHSYEFDVP